MPTITIDGRMALHSGIGTYLTNLVPEVARLLPDVAFRVVGPREVWRPLLEDLPNAVPHHCTTGIYTVREQWDVLAGTAAESALLWVPHFNVPLFTPRPLVVTVHDTLPLSLPEYAAGVRKQLYARMMFRAIKRKAEGVLTVSSFTSRELERHLGPFAQEIHVTPLGVSPAWREVPEEPSPHPRPFFLFLGNVKPHKNVSGLLEAFRELVATGSGSDLVIVGKREGFRSPEAKPDLAGLEERVRFTGFVSDEELRRFTRHALALVFPSFYEGFGLPPLEAMTCGTPTLVSDRASLPEVCGDASLYCDPSDPHSIADGMRRLEHDPQLRTDLAERGRLHANGFTWRACAERTVALLQDVMAR